MDGFFENALRDDKLTDMKASTNSFSQIQALVFQLNNVNGKLYNNIFLKYSSADAPAASGAQTSWESLLDTAIMFKPHLVRNHLNGETEIFVQDMANNIYLINNVGRILWKKNLPDPIISPVHQVDVFRNGRLQMFFNTRNHLYVIDRNGNNVGNFPVALRSPATGSASLFDYDNNRQYRIIVACEDRRVYLYDGNGRIVDGWTFRQTEHPVQTDIYHFRHVNRDYIVFADRHRVYILDRQGRVRVTPEYNFPVGYQTDIALDRQRSRLALADTAGTVHFISLSNGRITQQKIKTFPSSHFFLFQDVDGDGNGDFIFAADNKLEVFRQDGRQILDIRTDEPITMRPNVYEFGAGDIRIGIVQPQRNLILLYDNRGRLSAGFPKRGSAPFTIGRLDRSSSAFNLFVGSSNNFLYNYSVSR
jgi:WD40 repeat protein